MADIIQYYCVGFKWKESQLPRFIEEGIWENGSDKYFERVNSVPVGSRLAAKTTFTRKEDDETISILLIHATGTVVENFKDGQTLGVKWDESFEPFEIKNKGAYRSTISRVNNVETIKAIFKNDQMLSLEAICFYSNEEFNKDYHLFPCFVLTKDRWDDFGYKTQYNIVFYKAEKDFVGIGTAKFFNKADDNGDLPETFYSLSDDICSLGQSNNYYINLREDTDKKIADYYLNAVNDVAINRGLYSSFEHENGFKISLLRSSEAQKALREGYRIFNNIDIENTFRFTFSTMIGNAIGKHSINFDFSEKEDLPFRIKVIIGKNGTGKTQFISRLASTLSGLESLGKFSPKDTPPFSRILAISYSLFDRFPRPKQTKSFSYYYCGFQGGKGFLTPNQINTRIIEAFSALKKSNRLQLFGKYLSQVLSDDITSEILDEDFANLNNEKFSFYDENGNSMYSSGQIVIILVLAEILGYITTESLLLFDEPETHLHPNSISLFISVLNRILERFNSYTIISTHSPQIVQEVPSKDIIVIERTENNPSVRGLAIETFGENLNTITEQIFHTINQDEYYRKFLRDKSSDKTYKELIRTFEQNSLPLSLNARIYLQSLYDSQ